MFSKRFEMSNAELRGVKRMAADYTALFYTKVFLESRYASCPPAYNLKHFNNLNREVDTYHL